MTWRLAPMAARCSSHRVGGADAIASWDLDTLQATPFGPQDTDAAGLLKISPDGSLIAFETWNEEDGDYVEVWPLDGGGLVYRTPGFAPAFNADGLLSLSGGSDSDPQIVVVDPLTGETVESFPTDFRPGGFAWSPDGTRIVATGGTVRETTAAVFDVQNGVEIVRPDVDRAGYPAWLPAGDSFVLGSESIPRVIDAETGEVLLELLGRGGTTGELQVVPGSEEVAAGGTDVIIFDASPLGGVEVGGWIAPVPIGLTPPSFDSSVTAPSSVVGMSDMPPRGPSTERMRMWLRRVLIFGIPKSILTGTSWRTASRTDRGWCARSRATRWSTGHRMGGRSEGSAPMGPRS